MVQTDTCYKLNTKAVTDVLDDWFADTGKPVSLRTDGGPQFRTEFSAWAGEQEIKHELSSPYHHESNGHAEVTVREMKRLLSRTGQNWKKFKRALREWRNTPRFDGLSPSQWLTGYRQRTDAPAGPSAYLGVSDGQRSAHLERRRRIHAKTKARGPQREEKTEKLIKMCL